MTGTPLSVIVVSRHRAAALKRCIIALHQQDHTMMEIIVVADPAGLASVSCAEWQIKTAAFDEANISAARNIGLGLASGTVVAFIDDDAVPEPSWASRLCAPFADNSVVAATGFVRGRNGISYQWRSSEVDAEGVDHPLAVDEEGVTLWPGSRARAIKTQGTNCAFRSGVLRQIGGFDPAFRFYLDEADVNLRLAPFGATAIVPMAQVHHGFLASDRRRADRVPLSLHEIAASTAVFLRRHAPERLQEGKNRLLQSERRRVLGHMIAGRLEPRDTDRLMRSLMQGWADGLSRPVSEPASPTGQPPPFLPAQTLGPRDGVLIVGRKSEWADLKAKAITAVAEGRIVTVFCFSFGWRRHVHAFQPEGFWLQTGGLWGRSDRDIRPQTGASLPERVQTEASRWAAFRPIIG